MGPVALIGSVTETSEASASFNARRLRPLQVGAVPNLRTQFNSNLSTGASNVDA